MPIERSRLLQPPARPVAWPDRYSVDWGGRPAASVRAAWPAPIAGGRRSAPRADRYRPTLRIDRHGRGLADSGGIMSPQKSGTGRLELAWDCDETHFRCRKKNNVSPCPAGPRNSSLRRRCSSGEFVGWG